MDRKWNLPSFEREQQEEEVAHDFPAWKNQEDEYERATGFRILVSQPAIKWQSPF